MISVSGFGEFSSGSVQSGAFSAMFNAVAENSLVSNHILFMIWYLYLKNMKRICDEVWLCEILSQRKCVYLQRQWNIVKLNSENKSSSNGLCSATIISGYCGKNVQASNPTSVQPQQLAPTPPPKCQQHNHLHQHHLNIKFSQQSTFSTCRISIVHFPQRRSPARTLPP